MSVLPEKLKEIRGKYFVLGGWYFNIFPKTVTEGVDTKNGIKGTMLGEDDCGFPIFYEPQSKNECIYRLEYNMPDNKPVESYKVQIADSFSGFVDACKLLEELSVSRYSEEEYKANSLNLTEIEVFLNTLSKLNPDSNIYFWENIFENIHPDYEVKYPLYKGVILAHKKKKRPSFWSIERQIPIPFK